MSPTHRTRCLLGALRISGLLAIVLAVLTCGFPASSAKAQAADSPCLQKLNDQKAGNTNQAKAPGWFSQHAAGIMGGTGAVGGAVIGNVLCKRGTPQQRMACMAIGGLAGAAVGSQLGKMLSEADKKRYQEASYKVALTGRPQSLTTDNGCMVVEPVSAETFEDRQVDLALGTTVATPQKLRAVAMPYVRPSSASVAADPAPGKGVTKVDANVPSFVMGSTDSGKYLLLGREDADQGFIGAGYVDAQGWVASPDSNPTSIGDTSGQPKIVKVAVEVPCRQISSSIRVEASNKQETYPGKVCRLPNGVAESL